jgi:hypothetical protein
MSVAACGADEAKHYPLCLFTSGSKLISGSALLRKVDEDTKREVRVWDLDTMACEHMVREAAGVEVWCLAGSGEAVWGGVGESVVVWGRD